MLRDAICGCVVYMCVCVLCASRESRGACCALRVACCVLSGAWCVLRGLRVMWLRVVFMGAYGRMLCVRDNFRHTYWLMRGDEGD